MKQVCKYAYIVALLGCVIVAVFYISSHFTVYVNEHINDVYGGVTPIMHNGMIYTQKFEVGEEELSGIYLLPATYEKELYSGRVYATIVDESGNVLNTITVESHDIKDGDLLYMPLENVQELSGSSWTLKLEAEGFEEEDKLAFWLGDSGLPLSASDGHQPEHPLFVILEYSTYVNRWQRAYPFLIMAAILAACYPLGMRQIEGVKH